MCSAASVMFCFTANWDFLGLCTGLGPGWYTGASASLTDSDFTSDIPILGGTLFPTIGVDAWWIGSMNQTLWLPEIGVQLSGICGSWSTISLRMPASPSSDDVILGGQAATPLLILTVPDTVLTTASLKKSSTLPTYAGYFCWGCFCFWSYPLLLISFTFRLSTAR